MTRSTAAVLVAPSTRSGSVPPISQTPCPRAIAASASWIGPAPARSAIASLSRSLRPMKQKYSGSATSFAPAVAAPPTRRRAAATLVSTLGVETIWMAAIFMRGSSARHCGRGLGRRCRFGGRFADRVALDALDLRIVPRPADVELARARGDERLSQEVLRKKGAEADRRVDDRERERRGAGIDLGDDDDAQV